MCVGINSHTTLRCLRCLRVYHDCFLQQYLLNPSRAEPGLSTLYSKSLVYWWGSHKLFWQYLWKDESESRSVVSDSLQPCGLYSPWNSPGQNTGAGSLSLLQGIFPTQGSNPGLPHGRWILYQLSQQPFIFIILWGYFVVWIVFFRLSRCLQSSLWRAHCSRWKDWVTLGWSCTARRWTSTWFS